MALRASFAALLLVVLLSGDSVSLAEAAKRKKAAKTPSAQAPSPPPPKRSRKARPPTGAEDGSVLAKPNWVVLLVDDQDYMLNSTHRGYMPRLHQYIGDEGLHLDNFIVTTSICCPSRTSILTAQYAHNHNVTSNQAPQGSWSKFDSLKLDRRSEGWLPTWLKAQGYNTYFTGKFLNGFDVKVGDKARCPTAGWDMFDPLTDSSVYDYFNYQFTPNCAKMDSYSTEYQTDTIKDRSLAYIDDAVQKGKPFYLQINPAACHTACPKGEEEGTCVNPQPAPRHKGTYDGKVKVPRSTNWGVFLPPELDLTPDEDLAAKGIDRHYAARLETMMSVDEMIEALYLKLQAQGILDKTYFVYVSDNGYHLGNHGMAKGKHLPYEEDIRVPFYIRGPNIKPGSVSSYMASMVDLTTTVVTMAGGDIPSISDGLPLPLDRIAANDAGTGRYPNFPRTVGPLRDILPLELWANTFDKRIDKKDYRSVRACGTYDIDSGTFGDQSRCYKFNVWCVWPEVVNWHELYDLTNDIGEINNLWEQASDPRISRLLNRMNAMVQALGYCKAQTCRDVWSVLHPDGSVQTFDEAMQPRYDNFYSKFTTFKWMMCTRYYDPINNEVADPRLGGVSKFVTTTRSVDGSGQDVLAVHTSALASAATSNGGEDVVHVPISSDGKGHFLALDEMYHERRMLRSAMEEAAEEFLYGWRAPLAREALLQEQEQEQQQQQRRSV